MIFNITPPGGARYFYKDGTQYVKINCSINPSSGFIYSLRNTGEVLRWSSKGYNATGSGTGTAFQYLTINNENLTPYRKLYVTISAYNHYEQLWFRVLKPGSEAVKIIRAYPSEAIGTHEIDISDLVGEYSIELYYMNQTYPTQEHIVDISEFGMM